jgi:4-alpha-glucanotransferase
VDEDRPGTEPEVWWDLIALVFSSRARVAMVQAQDVLGLGSEARMNQPGTAKGAWKWRLSELPSPDHARRLRAVAEAAGRLPDGS